MGIADSLSLNMSLRDFLEFASQLNVGIAEIKMDQPHLLSTLSNFKQQIAIRDIIQSFDLIYFVHAPYIDTNLASMNSTVKKASEKTVLESIIFAAKVEAQLVITHIGRLSRDYQQEMVSKALRNVVPCLRSMTSIAKDYGLTFTIENDHKSDDRHLAGLPEQLEFLIKEVGCHLTLDIGHANTFGDPKAFITTLAEHTVNIHLHDNKGERDTHLSLGKGQITFPAVIADLRKLKYSEPFILEVHSSAGLRESLTLLRKL
ncbi:sugar phosphate isomerase/epimerase [Candidatus Bathyarchaeota archaeon]|nr:sugar phosphate isomerase/epimerase [Candidatus Bathyarchaeota archaeon]